jgi:hypothetical protein
MAITKSLRVGHWEKAKIPVIDARIMVVGYETFSKRAGDDSVRSEEFMPDDMMNSEYARSGMATRDIKGMEGEGAWLT